MMEPWNGMFPPAEALPPSMRGAEAVEFIAAVLAWVMTFGPPPAPDAAYRGVGPPERRPGETVDRVRPEEVRRCHGEGKRQSWGGRPDSGRNGDAAGGRGPSDGRGEPDRAATALATAAAGQAPRGVAPGPGQASAAPLSTVSHSLGGSILDQFMGAGQGDRLIKEFRDLTSAISGMGETVAKILKTAMPGSFSTEYWQAGFSGTSGHGFDKYAAGDASRQGLLDALGYVPISGGAWKEALGTDTRKNLDTFVNRRDETDKTRAYNTPLDQLKYEENEKENVVQRNMRQNQLIGERDQQQRNWELRQAEMQANAKLGFNPMDIRFGGAQRQSAATETGQAAAGRTYGYQREAEQSDIARRAEAAEKDAVIQQERDRALAEAPATAGRAGQPGQRHRGGAGGPKESAAARLEQDLQLKSDEAERNQVRGSVAENLDQQVRLQNQLVESRQKGLQLELSKIDEINSASQKRVDALMAVRDAESSIIQADKQRMQSIKEDFGLMLPGEQALALKTGARPQGRQGTEPARVRIRARAWGVQYAHAAVRRPARRRGRQGVRRFSRPGGAAEAAGVASGRHRQQDPDRTQGQPGRAGEGSGRQGSADDEADRGRHRGRDQGPARQGRQRARQAQQPAHH